MSLLDEIEPLKQAALAELKAAPDLAALEQAKGNWTGTHGKFTALTKQLGSMPKGDRPAAGKLINQAKNEGGIPLPDEFEQTETGYTCLAQYVARAIALGVFGKSLRRDPDGR